MTRDDVVRFGDTVEGEPGEGRRLVPIGPGRWAWVAPEAIAEWDERNWRPLGGWGES